MCLFSNQMLIISLFTKSSKHGNVHRMIIYNRILNFSEANQRCTNLPKKHQRNIVNEAPISILQYDNNFERIKVNLKGKHSNFVQNYFDPTTVPNMACDGKKK